MNCKTIADQVYAVAADSSDPLGPVVKEALEVIDHCLDVHGWVTPKYLYRNEVKLYTEPITCR